MSTRAEKNDPLYSLLTCDWMTLYYSPIHHKIIHVHKTTNLMLKHTLSVVVDMYLYSRLDHISRVYDSPHDTTSHSSSYCYSPWTYTDAKRLKDNYVIKRYSTACSTYYSIRVGLSELRVFEFQCSSKSTHNIQEPYESTYQ